MNEKRRIMIDPDDLTGTPGRLKKNYECENLLVQSLSRSLMSDYQLETLNWME